MLIPLRVVQTVDAQVIQVHAKVCDACTYILQDAEGKQIAKREDYVPTFFPGEHYGDYLVLNIDIETGHILNWKKPDPADVAAAFGLLTE